MAYLHDLTQSDVGYSHCFFLLHKQANVVRKKELTSAIRIQSWFRSLKVQLHIKFLNSCAIVIQKTYRGYVTRKFYRQLVHDVMSTLMKIHYDEMATKIQARWRGYYVRKFKADYYCRKNYLEGLVKKNEQTLVYLHQVGETNKFKREMELHNKIAKEDIYNLRSTHYILSTKVCNGIYNSPMAPPVEKESRLKAVNPLSCEERDSLKEEKQEMFLRSVTGIPRHHIEDDTKTQLILPPLCSSRPQGPFRTPAEVQKQRYKELEPTLRVATDYFSVEKAHASLYQDEWTKRVIDHKFLPSQKSGEEYQPALHTTSSYGRLKYGTKHFRDEGNPEKVIHKKTFQRVVSPIPCFDQVGKSY